MNLQLQELNFTLFVTNFNPAIFNLNTLQYGGVIQSDWKLAEDPIYNENGVKLVFTNQVRILAQPNRILFAETVGGKRLQDIWLPTIVKNSLQTFPHIEYHTISLKPGGYTPFDSDLEACQYLSKGLLASTLWQKFQGQEISAAGLKLAYPYKTGSLYLDINQASVEISGVETPAVWFAGNFNYQLLGQDSTEKKNHLEAILRDWAFDIKNFQSFIDNELLAISIIPSVNLFPL